MPLCPDCGEIVCVSETTCPECGTDLTEDRVDDEDEDHEEHEPGYGWSV